MIEHGTEVSFAQACNNDKEHIRMALQNKKLSGQDNEGFIYVDCDRKEAEDYILAAYDNLVRQAKRLALSGRVVERILKEREIDIPMDMYARYMREEKKKDEEQFRYDFESYEEAGIVTVRGRGSLDGLKEYQKAMQEYQEGRS